MGERPEWPNLRWQDARLLEPLAAARLKQGHLLGSMARIGFSLQLEAQLNALTEDAIKSSEIEAEVLDRNSVRSSIAHRLGIPQAAVAPPDRRTAGVVEMMLDATQNYAAPLTQERLWAWQAALFPTGYSGLHHVKTGSWRDDADGPMQVVSGPIGRQRVHDEAPPASRLETEMRRFLDRFGRLIWTGRLALLWPVALVVCNHPPVRRWQRPHRARRSLIKRWRNRRPRGNGSTACPARSETSARTTTTRLRAHRSATWT